MKRGNFLFSLILALGIAAPAVLAQENVWDMAQSEQYGKKAAGMLGRGLLNAATCFVDLIVQTVEGTKAGPPFVGTLTGLGGGIGCAALRATSGVLDVGTFWVPGFNGFPVSRSYNNCLEMEEESSSMSGMGESMTSSMPSSTYVMPSTSTDEMPKEEKRAEKKHDAMEYVKK